MKVFAIALLAILLIACNKEPDDYEHCTLKASRQSKGMKQFNSMIEICRQNFPDR